MYVCMLRYMYMRIGHVCSHTQLDITTVTVARNNKSSGNDDDAHPEADEPDIPRVVAVTAVSQIFRDMP
jgi:hypothetical protein